LGALCLLLSAPACSGEVVVAPTPVDRGIVSVTQFEASTQPWAGVYAAFSRQVVDPCTTLDTEGFCRLVECRVGPKAGAVSSTESYVRVDAGTVTIAGSLGEATIPFEKGRYQSTSHDGLVFATGDVKLAVAGSDTVAPISVTLLIPPPPVVTSALNVGVIDRSLPFAITWVGDAPEGRMHAWITTHPEATTTADGIYSGNVTVSVECSAHLSLGSLEMSPALLSQLTPGTLMKPELVVRFGAYEERDHEGWQLQFSAESEPRNPDGTFVFSHPVTLK
jgi:hypothetical protein